MTQKSELPRIDKFFEYLEFTWIGENALIKPALWNDFKNNLR